MLIAIDLDNYDKKFNYIYGLIEYEFSERDGGYISTKWKEMLGTPYINITGKVFARKNMVQEDREWIKDIFESLVIGEIWKWK